MKTRPYDPPTFDTSGPAFPFQEKTPNGEHYFSHGGMSLRDYFAGQVIAGAVTLDDARAQGCAHWAYEVADAMLAARRPASGEEGR